MVLKFGEICARPLQAQSKEKQKLQTEFNKEQWKKGFIVSENSTLEQSPIDKTEIVIICQTSPRSFGPCPTNFQISVPILFAKIAKRVQFGIFLIQKCSHRKGNPVKFGNHWKM
jgi:hypothetical protein